MKKTLALLALAGLALSTNAQQQISNSGLEHWSSSSGTMVPDSFYTSDVLLDNGTATQSIDAHSGNYSVLLETKQDPVFGNDAPGRLVYGATSLFLPSSWPFTSRPVSLKFWYKFTTTVNDTAYVSIYSHKWNSPPLSTPVGHGSWTTSTNASTWTLAEIPLTYNQAYNPDSIQISFQNCRYTPHLGTKFWIDDIVLEYSSTGVEQVEQGKLVKLYPNPSKGLFIALLPGTGKGDLKVIDVSGKIIYEAKGLIDKAVIDCKNWSNGIYIVQVTMDDQRYTEKLYLNQ